MNTDEKSWVQAVTEAIADLQAHRIAQARVIRALLSTHPDPVRMREALAAYSSELVMHGYLADLLRPESGEVVQRATARALEDWRGYLENDLPKNAPDQA